MIHTDERDSITVLLDSRDGDREVRPFYCPKCGKCVCEIVGNVKMLVPGMPDPQDMGRLGTRTVLLCRGFLFNGRGEKQRCDAKYAF